MEKKEIEYQYQESESSSFQEPVVSYQRDLSSREIPEHIMRDIQVSLEEYKKGLAIPVVDFMNSMD